jgi:hypothetical protein
MYRPKPLTQRVERVLTYMIKTGTSNRRWNNDRCPKLTAKNVAMLREKGITVTQQPFNGYIRYKVSIAEIGYDSEWFNREQFNTYCKGFEFNASLHRTGEGRCYL